MKEGANNKTSLPEGYEQKATTFPLQFCAPRWEYMELIFTQISELDVLGDDGWELVTVAIIPNKYKSAFLKRPVLGNGGVTV